MIEAEVICDSISPEGIRLTSFLLKYHRFIHSEFMTHRMLSRNSSSSRATPVAKNIEFVRSNARMAPLWWGAEQKGMQSGDELEDNGSALSMRALARGAWGGAALQAAAYAEMLVRYNVHKSIVNRILEPYLPIRTLATATEWMNFFGLRLDRAAQPEMRILAEKMWAAWNESTPVKRESGSWHLPFVEDSDFDTRIARLPLMEQCIKISVARCARLSYMSFDTGKHSTIEEDLKLYHKLVGAHPMHASPAEHQATPDQWIPNHFIEIGEGGLQQEVCGYWTTLHHHGNFKGWCQYRKMLKGEAVAPMPEGYAR